MRVKVGWMNTLDVGMQCKAINQQTCMMARRLLVDTSSTYLGRRQVIKLGKYFDLKDHWTTVLGSL